MNTEKYRNVILFFAENVPNLGKTKLNKLLYFLDFDHFEKYGTSVTDDSYINKDLGPVPEHSEEIVCAMQEAKLLEVHPEPLIDYIRYTLLPLGQHDPSAFLPTEMEMLCGVADKWHHHTAQEIVIASHGEAPWIATRKGEQIPYALAYYRGKFENAPHHDEDLVETATCPDTQDS